MKYQPYIYMLASSFFKGIDPFGRGERFDPTDFRNEVEKDPFILLAGGVLFLGIVLLWIMGISFVLAGLLFFWKGALIVWAVAEALWAAVYLISERQKHADNQ